MADEVNVKVTGSTGDLQAAMAQASASVRESVASMSSSLEALKGAAASVQSAMVGITAVLAGGAAFRSAIEATVTLTKESNALGKQFGISATEASIMKVAMDDVFVTQEQVSAAGGKIALALKKNESAFADLGVATRDANGNFRSTFDIMTDTNAALMRFREGTDRNVEGMKIYGRAWAEVAPTMRLTKEVMDEAEEKAKSLNLVVGVESIQATQRYRAAMNDVHDVLDGLKKSIGDALLPTLTELANQFSSTGPEAINTTRAALIGLVAAFQAIRVIVGYVWDSISEFTQKTTVSVLNIAEVANKAAHFDFSGAKEAWARGGEQLKDITDTTTKSIEARWAAAQLAVSDSMTRMFGGETASKKKEGGATSAGGDESKKETLEQKILDESRAMLQRNIISHNGYDAMKTDIAEVDRMINESWKLRESRAAMEEKLAHRHTAEAVKEAQQLQRAIRPMQMAFDQAFMSLIRGTTSVKGALQGLGMQFGQMAEMAVFNYMKAAIAAKLFGKESALAQIKANAASAASGAYNAMVGIPYVGPILAPIAAGVAYAGVLAFGDMASAAGGYDIPDNVNPVTQLHKREMVLPAPIADTIRGMAQGPQGPGGGPKPRMGLTVQNAGGGNVLITKANLQKHLRDLHRSFGVHAVRGRA